MRTVLICGGCGYIGINLANIIKQTDKKVIVIDNLLNPALNHYSTNNDVEKYSIDVRNVNDLFMIFQNNAITDVIWSIDVANMFGIDYYSSNLCGLHSLIMCMNTFNVSNFIYLSSSDIYGNGKNCKESTKGAPITLEGTMKLMSENMIDMLYKGTTYILRLATVIGVNTDNNIKSYRYNIFSQIELYNQGLINNVIVNSILKDYIHINDICDCVNKCLEFTNDFEKNVIVLNIGTNNQYTDKKIIETYESIKKVSLRKYNGNYNFICSINTNKSRDVLDWSSKYSIINTLIQL